MLQARAAGARVGWGIHQNAGIEAILVAAGSDGAPNCSIDAMAGALAENRILFVKASAAPTRPLGRRVAAKSPDTYRHRASLPFSPGLPIRRGVFLC
jgi:hypothetical protein